MFTCRNKTCEAQWEESDVVIKNEGQGLLFRCPLCATRNYLERFEGEDGSVLYEQLEGRPSSDFGLSLGNLRLRDLALQRIDLALKFLLREFHLRQAGLVRGSRYAGRRILPRTSDQRMAAE